MEGSHFVFLSLGIKIYNRGTELCLHIKEKSEEYMNLVSIKFLGLTIQDNDYWRAKFNISLLLAAILIYTSMFFINMYYLGGFVYALIDAVGAVFATMILFYFRKSKNIQVTSWATTILITSLILVFIVLAEGYSFSVFWVTIIPPIAFFLLGRKWGFFIAFACFVLCIFLVFQQVKYPLEQVSSNASLVNVSQVCIIHLILFSFYEKARSSAYEQLKVQNKNAIEKSERDELTGLGNRSKFNEILQLKLNDISVNKETLCLLIIDIDHFKSINDTYGHLEGDRVLSGLSKVLVDSVRDDDYVTRWAGEEFAILLDNSKIEFAYELSERLRQHIASKPISGKHITVSIGVGSYKPGEDVSEFFERVDKALYNSKSNGRNRSTKAI